MTFRIKSDDDDNNIFSTGNNSVIVAAVDTGFLNMFSLPLLRGNPSTALIDPYSIVLTQNASRRLFGEKAPMGETFIAFQVPYNRTGADDSWFYPSGNVSFGNRTFVELSSGVDVKTVSANIRDIISKHTDGRVLTETYLQKY